MLTGYFRYLGPVLLLHYVFEGSLSERTIEVYSPAAGQLVAHLEAHGHPHQADTISADAIRPGLGSPR